MTGAEADAWLAELESGAGYAADEVHAYIRERVKGMVVSRPKTKSWRD